MAFVGLISEAPSGKTLQRFGIAGCGASALSGLQVKRHQAKHYSVLVLPDAAQAPYPAYRRSAIRQNITL
ncbi:hypothetical protein [Citrobacter portucalensis]